MSTHIIFQYSLRPRRSIMSWAPWLFSIRGVKPDLVYKDTATNKAILDHCPILRQELTPPWFLFNGHLQSAASVRPHLNAKVDYDREIVGLSDGGIVSLDWVVHPTNTYAPNHPTILVHGGSGGSSRDPYIQLTVKALAAQGWRVVVMNMRGCGNTPILTARCPNGNYTQDIRDIVVHLRTTVVQSGPLIALGYCAGANLFVKFAGEEGEACQLTAMVSISNFYDMQAVVESLNATYYNRYVYNTAVASAIKRQFFKNRANLDPFQNLPQYDLERLENAATLQDLDEIMSRRNDGYDSLDEFYRDASCVRYMEAVRIPLLCISALNDPFVTPEMIPDHMSIANDRIMFAKTASGGHLGFFHGDGTDMWTSDVIHQYCAAVLDVTKVLKEPASDAMTMAASAA
ncbi:Aste57867_1867 [Aphanomyces stellatus]|uniref:Aste57867_1867 protein n=1 Tax=Aphanomyces stellatus TaxID=120398 RepID=A0A485KBU1_9STRA|nr:hypothetical protein As57867_001865 [Aphanomyces stellatus]VFT79074.1 Aste57867_1867 [Aphanomyces stellatus]